jgi:fucose permease
MSNLHGMFSVGGMLGAALAALLLGAGVAPVLQLRVVAAAAAAVAWLASRAMLDTHAAAAGVGQAAQFVWPRGALLVIGLLIFAGMTAEGVMNDWCVIYMKQELGVPQARAALGYATFAGAMAAARFGGDALRMRYSERTVLRRGAALAAVAMAVLLLTREATLTLIGFALVGAGLAPVAPILFNAATRVPGASRAAAIASVTTIGYGGLMIGPPMVGSIATASSLTAALGVVVFASALLAVCARFVPESAG